MPYCCGGWDKAIAGNVLQQAFAKDIWNSDRFIKIRKTVNSRNPFFEGCRECIPKGRAKDIISRHFVKTVLNR
jgi:hypothetical protein